MELYHTKIKPLPGTAYSEIYPKAWVLYKHIAAQTKRRLKYYSCGLDLLQNSRTNPSSHQNQMKKSELLHRFTGIAGDGSLFYVQIKEDKNGNKYFMSVLPVK